MAVIEGGPGWHIDERTLLPTITDEALFRATYADDPAVEVLLALWSGVPETALSRLEPLLRGVTGSLTLARPASRRLA